MTIEDNKSIVRAWIDAWMKNDSAAIDALFAPNYTVNGQSIGNDGVKQAVQFLHSGLSNISAELHEIIAEGDKVVIRWTIRGHHTNDLMGIPPTGKEVELQGINIYQIVDQKIVANHEQTNASEVLQKLKQGSEGIHRR